MNQIEVIIDQWGNVMQITIVLIIQGSHYPDSNIDDQKGVAIFVPKPELKCLRIADGPCVFGMVRILEKLGLKNGLL